MLLTASRTWLLVALAGAALLMLSDASGQGVPGREQGQAQDCGRSQDCALGAFKGGEIRPLSEVLAVARKALPGEIIKIELEHDDGIWVYEVKVLTPGGRRREVEIDARSLAVIKID